MRIWIGQMGSARERVTQDDVGDHQQQVGAGASADARVWQRAQQQQQCSRREAWASHLCGRRDRAHDPAGMLRPVHP